MANVHNGGMENALLGDRRVVPDPSNGPPPIHECIWRELPPSGCRWPSPAPRALWAFLGRTTITATTSTHATIWGRYPRFRESFVGSFSPFFSVIIFFFSVKLGTKNTHPPLARKG